MKKPSLIPKRVIEKRFERRIESLRKAKLRLRSDYMGSLEAKEGRSKRLQNKIERYKKLFGTFTYSGILKKWLPSNLLYVIGRPESDFYLDLENITVKRHKSTRVFLVPETFSLIDKPAESFQFLREVLLACLCQEFDSLHFDYQNCKFLNIGAQVVLDIFLRDIFSFYNKCSEDPLIANKIRVIKKNIGVVNWGKTRSSIRKIMESVGSPSVHNNLKRSFTDIIPYHLCVQSWEGNFDPIVAQERKAIDTTTLADYVIKSLAKMKKRLTPAKLSDLCDIIGEILINAEEHSTSKTRFSIGYFQDIEEDDRHFGLFRLVILNFGRTIYEKFSDPSCPNQDIVKKMKLLSKSYTRKKLFAKAEFEEETLWTLYALQEGVSSINNFRGNGSIQFIEDFFNLGGEASSQNEKSRMTILSGNTRIIFDGNYGIMKREIRGEQFKVMTFNNSGRIQDKPDKEYVEVVPHYFPGTMLSARIYLDEEDFISNGK